MNPATKGMPEGKAVTNKKMFSRETAVRTTIQASPVIVWGLLTNAADYARWNSTVVSVTGEIRAGETIGLVSTLDENRTFKLKVKTFEPEKKLVWGDAMGSRVYTIEKAGDATEFSMSEKIGGPIFPLFARMIPDFDESFEQFSASLKKEAEAMQKSQSGK